MSPGIANSRNIRAGAAYIELTTQDSKLVRGLDKAQKRVKAFGKSVGEIGKRLTAVSAVAAELGCKLRRLASRHDRGVTFSAPNDGGLSTDSLCLSVWLSVGSIPRAQRSHQTNLRRGKTNHLEAHQTRYR